ncbi:MAG: hypothetical protein GWP08_03365 [Nitrospiraceae bacterium]|nr:hypothetical protein [Nitrospiraceae bacterium]
MGYAVELLLREDESQAIRRLFSTTGSVLAAIGTAPHISLAVFDDVDVPKLTSIVRAFAADLSPLTVRFSSVGVFPGVENVVFLAPVVTAPLLAAHAVLHTQLQGEGLSCDPNYVPCAWVPHCAITVEEPIAQTLETIRHVHDANVLGEYTISTVGVVEFRPLVTLSVFDLGEKVPEPAHAGDA